MRNVRLILSYDGSRFLGWQKTFTGPSIQGELEKALERILGEKVALEAASRTDRGVHAQGQSAHFFTHSPIELARLKQGLNAVLPEEISVQSADEMPEDFHPTLDARGKEYRYFLCNTPVQSPIRRLYSWHLHQPLDLPKMEEAASHLLGEKDFAALCNERQDDTTRTLHKLALEPLEEKGRIRIDIRGDNFLYKMARNIAGALVYAGLGKIKPSEIPSILSSRDRSLAPITAPAHGLFLWEVYYKTEAIS